MKNLGNVNFPLLDKKYETLVQKGSFIEFERVCHTRPVWEFDGGIDGPCLYLKTGMEEDEYDDLFFVAKARVAGSSEGYIQYGFFVNVLNCKYGKVFDKLDDALTFGETLLKSPDVMRQFTGLRPSVAEVTRDLLEKATPISETELDALIENLPDEERHQMQDQLKRPRT